MGRTKGDIVTRLTAAREVRVAQHLATDLFDDATAEIVHLRAMRDPHARIAPEHDGLIAAGVVAAMLHLEPGKVYVLALRDSTFPKAVRSTAGTAPL